MFIFGKNHYMHNNVVIAEGYGSVQVSKITLRTMILY